MKNYSLLQLVGRNFPLRRQYVDWEFLFYQWNDGMPRHFECFPLVWEILKRHNVPVEHLPLECERRWVYCSVSVLERWRNEREAGREKERERGGEERKVEERDKRVSVVESKRGREKEIKEKRKEIETKREREAEEGLSQRETEREREMVREKTAERENISRRASWCECVGSEQQHIRLHRGPWIEASWLTMPSTKTDVWFLTQLNSWIRPAGQGFESNRRGSGDERLLAHTKALCNVLL